MLLLLYSSSLFVFSLLLHFFKKSAELDQIYLTSKNNNKKGRSEFSCSYDTSNWFLAHVRHLIQLLVQCAVFDMSMFFAISEKKKKKRNASQFSTAVRHSTTPGPISILKTRTLYAYVTERRLASSEEKRMLFLILPWLKCCCVSFLSTARILRAHLHMVGMLRFLSDIN